VKSLSEIKSILHTHSGVVRERYGLTNLAVFGSVVRGEAKETSDVDILAEVERPIGLVALCGAENFLSDLIGMKVTLC